MSANCASYFVAGHIADMRRTHDVVHLEQGMARCPAAAPVRRRESPPCRGARRAGCNQRAWGAISAARLVLTSIRGRASCAPGLSAVTMPRAWRRPCADAGDRTSQSSKNRVLARRDCSNPSALGARERLRTRPGDHPHAEHLAIIGDHAADAPIAETPSVLPRRVVADANLPVSRPSTRGHLLQGCGAWRRAPGPRSTGPAASDSVSGRYRSDKTSSRAHSVPGEYRHPDRRCAG